MHGLPKSIVSDRGVQFVSGMWQQLSKDLGIKLQMSTAHRPQTDGQVERANKTLEEMLRSYVNTCHNDWDQWLDCAEFAINKARASATGASPFELVYQHTPMSPPERMLDNSLNPLQQSDKMGKQHFSSRRIGRKVGEEWWCRLRNARTALHQAKDRMKQNADKNRVERSFEIGDYVLLTSKYLNLKKPSVAKKFCPVFVGPFKVLERIGRSSYKLQLPVGCKMHDVIHVSKLWKYHQAPGEDLDVKNPLWLDGENLPEVSDILKTRGTDEHRYYLVQYKNRDNMYCTWEPEKTLIHHCSTLIDLFKTRRTERDPTAVSFVLLRSMPLTNARDDTTSVDTLPNAEEVCYTRDIPNYATELADIRSIDPERFFIRSMSASGPAVP